MIKDNSRKELIEHLHFIYKDRGGKIPSTVSLRMYKKATYQEYVNEFGSWKNALFEANFKEINRRFFN